MDIRRAARLLALGALLLGAAGRVAADEGRPLSLSEAIAEAITQNLGIRAAALNPRAQAEGVRQVRGKLDPDLRLSVSGGKAARPCYSTQECPDGDPLILSFDTAASLGVSQLTPLGGTLGLALGASTPVFSTAANFQDPGLTTSALVSVSQPLLQGAGYRINRLDIERALMEQALSWDTLRAEVQQLILSVHDAYWSLVSSRRALELREQSLDFALQQADMTRERIALGFAAPVEIYAVDQDVASRRADVEMAANQVRSAEIALRALLGWSVRGASSAAPILPTDEPPSPEIKLDEAAVLTQALDEDPTLKRARRQVEVQELAVKEARNGRLPGLSFNGTVGVSGSQASDLPSEPIWNAAMVLSVPMGNRQARARHALSGLDLDRAELSVAQREQEVVMAVDAAVRAVATARLRIELGSQSRELADRKLDAERERLARGESTLKNVLDYLEDRDQARLSELQARIDLAAALIRLDALQGSLLPEFGVELGEVGGGG